MGMGNLMVLSQITGYIFGVIFSLFTFPPIAVSQGHFDDHCILYSTGIYPNSSVGYVLDNWSLGTQCGFAIFIGITVMGISLWQSIRLSIHAIGGTDSSFLMTCVTLLFTVLVNVMLLAAAITVTEGYKVWCQAILDATDTSCEFAGYTDNLFNDKKIDPKGFNIDWGIAQFGLWSEFIVYSFLSACSFYKLCKLHKEESIFRSLSRERQRLLGHYEQPDI